MSASAGSSRRVLLVEDEAMVAMMLEGMLTDLGHEVVAIARTAQQAAEIAESIEIDFAILDVNLRGEYTYVVAGILRKRAIPFVFATGYGSAGLEQNWRDTPTLQKPFQIRELELRIGEALAAD